MPELPEVETTCLGIRPFVTGAKIKEIILRRMDLRMPISDNFTELEGRKILGVTRRSKYLLFSMDDRTTILIHLGMSGSLRVIKPAEAWKKHDHVGISLQGGMQLRFHDPRRFGLVIRIMESDPASHALLSHLGPEPLEKDFTGDLLFQTTRNRSVAIKSLIMNASVVVGVGNIYASEALFRAGISPFTPARSLTVERCESLAAAIRQVLEEAIKEGGTTLRDFLNSDGKPGYFKQRLFTYGRKGQPCLRCASLIEHAVTGQRATFWCPTCQS